MTQHQYPDPQSRRSTARRDTLIGVDGLILVLLIAAGIAGGLWWRWAHSRAGQIMDIRELKASERRLAASSVFKSDPATTPPAALAPASGDELREIAVDDAEGKLLWASPTAGPAISLAYMPAGVQCLVYVRPVLLMGHPEHDKLLAGLGPWGQHVVARLESLTGATLDELDSVLAGIVVGPDGDLEVCLRAELARTWDDAELASRFSAANRQAVGDSEVLAVGDRAWFLAPNADSEIGAMLVACPARLVGALAASAGEEPLVPRDLENLVAQSDSDRDVTVLLEPKFLAAGGTHLVEGAAAPLREVLTELIGHDATAIALSAHWGDRFFVELRAAPALNVSPRYLATALAQRVGDAPELVVEQVQRQAWAPYGQQVIQRFPAMLERLVATTRHAEVDKQAVVRAYLPVVAGHNLLMATELLLTQSTSAASAVPPGDEERTIKDRLAAMATLVFAKESLQRALELLSDELGAPIVIDGPAFQAAGVTQNQTLTLDLRDRPVEEILVEILRQANPDRSAARAADPRQVLVYVIERPESQLPATGGLGRITVTTRTAARERNLPLPAVFVGAGE